MMQSFPSEIRAYIPISLCGCGAYGEIWLVNDAVGTPFAIKIIRKSLIGDHWKREFNGLKFYRERITQYFNLIQIFYIEECADFFYYVMECADNIGNQNKYIPCTLATLLKLQDRFEEKQLISVFDNLLDGVQTLHAANLIHRDIKPENVLFVKGIPKLGDIGLVSSITRSLSLAGTQDYLPPEILTGKVKSMTQDMDLYALGKTLYCALTGLDANCFPVIPHEILLEPQGRRLRLLINAVCDPIPSCRIKDVNDFRKFLHGSSGFKYLLRRKVILVTTSLRPFFRVFFRVFKSKTLLLTLLLLTVVILERTYLTYYNRYSNKHDAVEVIEPKLFWEIFKETLWTYNPFTEKFDFYDFVPQTDFTLSCRGTQWLVDRQTYFKEKYRGIVYPDLSIVSQVGGDNDQGAFLAKQTITHPAPPFEYDLNIYRKHVKVRDGLNFDSWILPSGSKIDNAKILTLPSGKKSILKYNFELPFFYELNLSFNPYKTRGVISFIITAADYIEKPKRKITSTALEHQICIPIKTNEKTLLFLPTTYREQDESDDEKSILGNPKYASIPLKDKFYKIQILSTGTAVRIFLDECLVWYTFLPFSSGIFSIECNLESDSSLKLKDFSIYDVKHLHKGESCSEKFVNPVSRSFGQ